MTPSGHFGLLLVRCPVNTFDNLKNINGAPGTTDQIRHKCSSFLFPLIRCVYASVYDGQSVHLLVTRFFEPRKLIRNSIEWLEKSRHGSLTAKKTVNNLQTYLANISSSLPSESESDASLFERTFSLIFPFLTFPFPFSQILDLTPCRSRREGSFCCITPAQQQANGIVVWADLFVLDILKQTS